VSKNVSAPPTVTLAVFRLAALFTFLAVAMGAVVCATKSGASCPTWPGCRPNQLTPQWQLNPIIEFTHRVIAIAAGPLVLAAAVMSIRRSGRDWRVRILPWVALVGALASGAFGRLVVLSSLPTWLGAVDLFCALAAMTVMGVAAVIACAPATNSMSRSVAERRSLQMSCRLAAMSVTVMIVMHATGIFAAGTGSYTRCMGWPLWKLINSDPHPWLGGLRLGLAGLGAALVVTTAVVTARTVQFRRWGIAVAALFATEMLLGLMIRSWGFNTGVAAAYSVLAVALLWSMGLLMAVAGAARVATDVVPPQPAALRGEPAQLSRVIS